MTCKHKNSSMEFCGYVCDTGLYPAFWPIVYCKTCKCLCLCTGGMYTWSRTSLDCYQETEGFRINLFPALPSESETTK